MNSTYFAKCVLRPSIEICYLHGKGTHERIVMLHFDNALVHNTEVAQESLANFGFRRMEYRPHSSDLAPRDFFLFGTMKQAFGGQYFDSIDDLFMGVEASLGGLSVDFLHAVFQEWVRRLQL
jgi:hypothetical protein